MMLYVFHVDVGRMLTFDMTVAMSSVENLKETIQRLHNLPASNIVLLVSGGEMLIQSTQVSYYSAGTDTNPIYMFLTGDECLPPSLPPIEPDIDLRRQVDESHNLPAVLDTVRRRAALAVHMYELARDEERQCERLVHEQHLQQQGWSAVVANMEDLTNEFRQRFRTFCTAFDTHLRKRDSYFELLRNFNADLTQLERVPILPGLMTLAEADFHGFDEFLNNDDVFSRSQMQQESVLKAGETVDVVTVQVSEANVDTNQTFSTSIGDGDKSSTSPNKKLKMGDDITTQATTATATTMTTTPADEQERVSQCSTTYLSSRRPTLNLLQWITSKENHDALRVMSVECIQGLGTFNEEIYEKLKIEIQKIIKLAEQGDVKEIKGLGERLCILEEFKYKIKKMVQDQKELSTAFQQNQARALNLRDASILPDLCASHQSQLQVMLANHQKIRDHGRCIAKAKDELGKNLHTRLKRIVWIENAMSDFDNRLLFNHRCLRRAERHINIIEQIHRAPSIYVSAVAEVVRRKIFSSEFRNWASKLANDFDVIHSEEIRRRQEFNASFEGHFLNILFPGMNDMPPTFANENPLIFDTRLPNLTRSDIDVLSNHLPDLAPNIQLPDMGPVINFFVSRSGAHKKERLEELLKQQVAVALNVNVMECSEKSGTAATPLQHQRLTELQKQPNTDESETDTETEFEKVIETVTIATSTSENQPAGMMARSTATEHLITQSATTLTDESESSMRAQIDQLRSVLNVMSKLSVEYLNMARTNINSCRADTIRYRDELQANMQVLNEKWQILHMQCETQEQKRALELQQLQDQLKQRDNELIAEQDNVKILNIKCATLEAQVEELRDQLKTAEMSKDAAVAETREELIQEHKAEIESLRCRFKLMTSMEHSTSDTSLEKLERLASGAEQNVIDMQQHEQILAQQRAELEARHERVDSVALHAGILKDMLDERERQLEQLREHDKLLTQENFQLKTRIETLINEECNSWLKEKIEYLNRDKNRLEEELSMEKSRRKEMESSFAGQRCSIYEPQISSTLTRSKSSSSNSSPRYITLENCAEGDIVFVVWSIRHWQYMVVQDSRWLYFVHVDSLPGLNLSIPPVYSEQTDTCMQIPLPYYAIGRVIAKEYCQARKDENRYRVSKGFKFHRIKLAPLTMKARLTQAPECKTLSEAHSVAQQITTNTSTILMAPTTSHAASIDLAKTVTDSIVKPVTMIANISLGSTSDNSLYQSFKEHTVSVTSYQDDDDESTSFASERCRYMSTCEEDELLQTAQITAATAANCPQQIQQSVITEQPTSTSKMNLDALACSAFAVATANQQRQQQQQDTPKNVDVPITTTAHASSIEEVGPTTTECSRLPIIISRIDGDVLTDGVVDDDEKNRWETAKCENEYNTEK